jgi:hypothetical protein
MRLKVFERHVLLIMRSIFCYIWSLSTESSSSEIWQSLHSHEPKLNYFHQFYCWLPKHQTLSELYNFRDEICKKERKKKKKKLWLWINFVHSVQRINTNSKMHEILILLMVNITSHNRYLHVKRFQWYYHGITAHCVHCCDLLRNKLYTKNYIRFKAFTENNCPKTFLTIMSRKSSKATFWRLALSPLHGSTLWWLRRSPEWLL